mgnify:CR=1 FL=1
MRDKVKVLDEMMTEICDKLCRYPRTIKKQEDLDSICDGCPASKYIDEILNMEVSNE